MSKLQDLLNEIRELEARVSEEIGREAEALGYRVKQGRVYFEEEIAKRHKALAKGVNHYLAEASLGAILTVPVIYSLFLPLLLLDLMVCLYQAVCFPVYKIKKVRRGEYVIFDRHRLKYLNPIERLHCTYCSYANGLLAFAREVAARTEQYWCPIKHADSIKSPHGHYHGFLAYGDAEAYANELDKLRKKFQDQEES